MLGLIGKDIFLDHLLVKVQLLCYHLANTDVYYKNFIKIIPLATSNQILFLNTLLFWIVQALTTPYAVYAYDEAISDSDSSTNLITLISQNTVCPVHTKTIGTNCCCLEDETCCFNKCPLQTPPQKCLSMLNAEWVLDSKQGHWTAKMTGGKVAWRNRCM